MEYNIQNPIHFNTDNYLVSSFSNKTEIKPDLIDYFNECLKHLLDSKLVTCYTDQKYLDKYKCKYH